MESNYLIHYGVKGMKWGVRKDPERTARVKETVKDLNSTAKNLTGSRRSKSLTKYRKQNIDEMSDQELRNAINRMNMEQQYRQLTSVNFKKGNQMVGTVIKTEGQLKTIKKSSAFAIGRKIVTKGA